MQSNLLELISNQKLLMHRPAQTTPCLLSSFHELVKQAAEIVCKKGLKLLLLMSMVAAIAYLIYGGKSAFNVTPLKQQPMILSKHYEELELALIKSSLIMPPLTKAYNIKSKNETSKGQAQLIMQLFKNKKNGFFIECGALDGETRSNTLTLERDLDWRGLLIEGDPKNVQDIKLKNRKSWLLPNCLSPKEHMFLASFKPHRNQGKIIKDPSTLQKSSRKKLVKVVCFPLFSVLKALNQLEVDYFSLDVEGNEYEVLQTIPFHRVNITALSVEFTHVGKNTEGSKKEMISFMNSKGYDVRAKVTNAKYLANDFIFVKKGFNTDVSLRNIHTNN